LEKKSLNDLQKGDLTEVNSLKIKGKGTAVTTAAKSDITAVTAALRALWAVEAADLGAHLEAETENGSSTPVNCAW